MAAQLARTALVDPLTVALAVATLGAAALAAHPTWLIAAGATVGLLRDGSAEGCGVDSTGRVAL